MSIKIIFFHFENTGKDIRFEKSDQSTKTDIRFEISDILFYEYKKNEKIIYINYYYQSNLYTGIY
jgi:hypothetical protein